jgi:hypothetical protein
MCRTLSRSTSHQNVGDSKRFHTLPEYSSNVIGYHLLVSQFLPFLRCPHQGGCSRQLTLSPLPNKTCSFLPRNTEFKFLLQRVGRKQQSSNRTQHLDNGPFVESNLTSQSDTKADIIFHPNNKMRLIASVGSCLLFEVILRTPSKSVLSRARDTNHNDRVGTYPLDMAE